MIEGRRVLPIGRKPLVLEYNRGGITKQPSSRPILVYALSSTVVTTVIVVLTARAARMGPFAFHCSLTPQVTCLQDFSAVELSLDLFDVDVGRYPTSEEGLSALLEAPPGTEARWHGPYIKPREVRDPWGRVFVYHVRGTAPHDSYHLVSRGPDGIEGTSDDLATDENFGT